ncbi:MAG: phosphate/phosphite/phosphonate ABC transporter substrate-binding protein [Planctomycetes bacterium]|nr:phosphate/phosphite/phosphonate ABC transporter substrate-binding protein [Planctomycetota bacterium]
MHPSKVFTDSTYTVYFYNPETNINNYVLLKGEFDKYLSDYGPFKFQPFSDRKTFEEFLIKKKDGIFLLSSWHYHDLLGKAPIKPVFVGFLKGKTTQRKILSAKEGITSIDALKGKSIASAGSEEYTKNILIQMLGKEQKDIIDSVKILTVPKDIDALMAVGFGMANSALTAEISLTKLLAINPKQYGMLNQLASMETLLQIVAAPNLFDENVGLLLSIIQDMVSSAEGKRNLKMISLDGWKKIGNSERLFLKK